MIDLVTRKQETHSIVIMFNQSVEKELEVIQCCYQTSLTIYLNGTTRLTKQKVWEKLH